MRYYSLKIHRSMWFPKTITIAVNGDMKQVEEMLQQCMNGNSIAIVDINADGYIIDRNAITAIDITEVELEEEDDDTIVTPDSQE